MRLLKHFTLLVALITTATACAAIHGTGTHGTGIYETEAESVVIDTSCAVFKPITFSAKHDTSETIQQIRQHNAKHDALCLEDAQ